MATSFNFLEAEKELQQPKKPSFNFLEAEKALQPRQATTQPVQARQAVQTPVPTSIPELKQQERPAFLAEGTEEIPRMLPRQRATVAGVPSTRPTVSDIVKDEQKFGVVQRFMQERYPNMKLPDFPTSLF